LKQKLSSDNFGVQCLSSVTSGGEENPAFANLAAALAEIRKLKGISGYILRTPSERTPTLTWSELQAAAKPKPSAAASSVFTERRMSTSMSDK
jgi:hypothetical protein